MTRLVTIEQHQRPAAVLHAEQPAEHHGIGERQRCAQEPDLQVAAQLGIDRGLGREEQAAGTSASGMVRMSEQADHGGKDEGPPSRGPNLPAIARSPAPAR